MKGLQKREAKHGAGKIPEVGDRLGRSPETELNKTELWTCSPVKESKYAGLEVA